MAVLVRITDYATQYFTLFIADYTVGTTIFSHKQTVLSHCVDRSPFPSTLLAVDYSCWRPTIHRRLSWLSLPLLSPTMLLALTGWLSRLTDFSLRSSCLKVGMCERYSRHLSQLFIYALQRVGYWGDVCCPFTMHSGLWLTVACISIAVYIRYHGYIASPLSGNGTEFREICYTGSPLQYLKCPWTIH
jgi:hypothetical protein